MFLAVACAGRVAPDAHADDAKVIAVSASCDPTGICSFDVTVQHPDTGWTHFADRWDVVTPDGTILATRVLRHPHVEEQPFTRSLGGVEVPAAAGSVRVRAHCSKNGYGGKELEVQVPRRRAGSKGG